VPSQSERTRVGSPCSVLAHGPRARRIIDNVDTPIPITFKKHRPVLCEGPRDTWPRQSPMQIFKRRPGTRALILTNPRASTRASSPLPHRGVIVTGSTFALSPSSHASSAVASHPTRNHDERAWWQTAGIDKDTRIDEGRIEPDRTPQAAAAERTPQTGSDVVEPQAQAQRPPTCSPRAPRG
jgi:hypothetical protein